MDRVETCPPTSLVRRCLTLHRRTRAHAPYEQTRYIRPNPVCPAVIATRSRSRQCSAVGYFGRFSVETQVEEVGRSLIAARWEIFSTKTGRAGGRRRH